MASAEKAELSRLLHHLEEINSDPHFYKTTENGKHIDVDREATRRSEVVKEQTKLTDIKPEMEKHNGVDIDANKQHIKKEIKKQRIAYQKLIRMKTEAELIRLLRRLERSRVDQYPSEKVDINTRKFLTCSRCLYYGCAHRRRNLAPWGG